MTSTHQRRNTKTLGAMKHLLLELQKVGTYTDDDRQHLLDRYERGQIISFGHLAEILRNYYGINQHNYLQIINYGIAYGEPDTIERKQH